MNSKIETSPLVVDLDGTLLRSDLLIETLLIFFKTHPLRFFEPFFWLAKGKAFLKEKLAQSMDIDVTVLPYDTQVIEFIEAERKKGRQVVLATASHHTLVERIADHLPLFDLIIASNIDRNLAGDIKRQVLVTRFGEGGFDYMGNAHDDMTVWDAARYAYVVNPDRSVQKRTRGLGNVKAFMYTYKPSLRDWTQAFRLHQWLKNLLVLVPLLAAHRANDVTLLLDGLLAFLFFGVCASSVYILNDLIDLNDDRHHPRKRQRPFASGRLSTKMGLLAFPLLLITAFTGALWLLPIKFVAVMATYYGLTLAYSLGLKRYMTIDVITLASLYTLRIIAGSAAVDVPLSFWMLGFSMFMFLSLALVKRYAEFHQARIPNLPNHTTKIRGRGYYPNDFMMIATLGGCAGYMAVMVLALYINDPNATALYSHPRIIWLACPLLLTWISRVWMLTHRGQMNEDPILFAFQDRASLITGLLFTLVFWAAI